MSKHSMTKHSGRGFVLESQLCFVLILLASGVSASMDLDIPERGVYIGCYTKQIDLYQSPAFAQNVENCLDICETSYFRYAILWDDRCACSNDLGTEELEKSICNARCSRNKSQFCGGVDAQSYYDTGVRASGPPKNFRAINQSDTTITLHWDETQQPDKVTNFLIKANVIKSFATYPLFAQPEWIVPSQRRTAELTNLHPGALYNISITALCGIIECGMAFIAAETVIGVPDPAPIEPKIIKESENSVIVDIEPSLNNNGPISYYRLIVMFVDDSISQIFDEGLLTDYKASVEDGLPYYITAELDYQNKTRRFTIGNGRTYRGYYNAPLPPKSHVHISIGVVSNRSGVTKIRYSVGTHEQHNRDRGKAFIDSDEISSPADNQSSVIALIVACVIFGTLLLCSIFAYCYLRLKTSHRPHRLSDTHELTLQGPIVEVDNNGYVPEDLSKGNFRVRLNSIVDNLPSSQRYARNAIRLNVDDIIGQGNFGDVITGKVYTNVDAYDCQVHVISDDMESQDQSLFLKDLDQLIQIMPHEKFLNFFGISASPEWVYVIFERSPAALKSRLIEARLPPNVDSMRFSAMSEECILQWIFDISVAMEYLEGQKIIHRKLCSYNIFVTPTNQIKVSLFGPVPFYEYDRFVDISRWMAPEVLRFQHHSIKSDVWSFACVAWECCCLGGTLFASITSQDLLPRIKNGARPEQVPFVYSDLYQLFLNCWQLEPSERPDFEEIAFNIRQMLTSPRHVLSYDRCENLFVPHYLPLLEVQN